MFYKIHCYEVIQHRILPQEMKVGVQVKASHQRVSIISNLIIVYPNLIDEGHFLLVYSSV